MRHRNIERVSYLSREEGKKKKGQYIPLSKVQDIQRKEKTNTTPRKKRLLDPFTSPSQEQPTTHQ